MEIQEHQNFNVSLCVKNTINIQIIAVLVFVSGSVAVPSLHCSAAQLSELPYLMLSSSCTTVYPLCQQIAWIPCQYYSKGKEMCKNYVSWWKYKQNVAENVPCSKYVMFFRGLRILSQQKSAWCAFSNFSFINKSYIYVCAIYRKELCNVCFLGGVGCKRENKERVQDILNKSIYAVTRARELKLCFH